MLNRRERPTSCLLRTRQFQWRYLIRPRWAERTETVRLRCSRELTQVPCEAQHSLCGVRTILAHAAFYSHALRAQAPTPVPVHTGTCTKGARTHERTRACSHSQRRTSRGARGWIVQSRRLTYGCIEMHSKMFNISGALNIYPTHTTHTQSTNRFCCLNGLFFTCCPFRRCKDSKLEH